MIVTLIWCVVIIALGGLAAWVLSRAPFMTAEYKTWTNWLIGVVVVVLVIALLLAELGVRLP